MTPAEREELAGIRTVLEYVLSRVNAMLGATCTDAPSQVPSAPNGLSTGKTNDAMIRVLSEAGCPMQAKDVHAALVHGGRCVTRAAVYVGLLRLANAGRIQRIGHGTYAATQEKP